MLDIFEEAAIQQEAANQGRRLEKPNLNGFT